MWCNFIESVTFAHCRFIIVLNFNELVMFMCCTWAARDQIDLRLNIYIYINGYGYAVDVM